MLFSQSSFSSCTGVRHGAVATRTPHPLVSGITRIPHFLVPGITRTPQKNLRLRRIIILRCQYIYAGRSQSVNKFATAALIVTTLHRLKRTVCTHFWFIRIVALFSAETSFADYKMVQCPAHFKKIACGANTPRLLHECSPVCSGIEKCMFVYHEHHLLHPTCTIIDITWPPI